MVHIPTPPRALVLALSFATLLAACDREQQQGPQGMQGGERPPPSVAYVVTTSQALPVITEVPGRTAPYLIAEVRPQVTGLITQRPFKEGSEVKAGALLYEIDRSTYQAAHNSAKASLARAEASLNSARTTARRFAGLRKIDAVSQQQSDDADAALKVAQAEVEAAKAAIEAARIDLNRTRVMAPISGLIGRSAVTPGALVTANQPTALATIQQLDPIYVDLTQSSADLLRLRRDVADGRVVTDSGTIAVDIILEDGSAYSHQGRLAFSEVSVDRTTGEVTMRAVVENPDDILLPGMYVRARFSQGTEERAVTVPQGAVIRNQRGESLVMIVKDDNTIEERKVRTDRAHEGQWVISEGLGGGEKVVVEGLQGIRGGATVQPMPYESSRSAAPAGSPAAQPAAAAPTAEVAPEPAAAAAEPAPAPPAEAQSVEGNAPDPEAPAGAAR